MSWIEVFGSRLERWHIRGWMHERFREVLSQQSAPWIEVSGSVAERLAEVLPHVDRVLATNTLVIGADSE